MATKAERTAASLAERFERGDYALAPMPSVRTLADEFGISTMTARRALQLLVDSGIMEKDETGRVQRSAHGRQRAGMQVAFVAPAYASTSIMAWLRETIAMVELRGGAVRPVYYAHDHDPAILATLNGSFDGVIIFPPLPLSSELVRQLVRYRERVVTIAYDLTEHGIPCVDGASPRTVDLLVERLAGLGHSVIDAVTTTPEGHPVIAARLDQWWRSLSERGLSGTLRKAPVQSFDDPMDRARDMVRTLLESGRLDATAIFCPTLAAARGAIRGAADAGLQPGRDLSFCAFGEQREASMCVPSITVVEIPNRSELVQRMLDWIETKGEGWAGPLLIRPDDADVHIFDGESTRPSAKHTSGM